MGRSSLGDVVIAGAGIIGLSLGMELLQRGLSVIVLDRQPAMRSASWAAGGMLAARDPENPAALLPLSLRSLELYPEYRERVQASSRHTVPVRTTRTLQQIPARVQKGRCNGDCSMMQDAIADIPGLRRDPEKSNGHTWAWLEEESLDPRDLCRALPAAFLAEKGTLREDAAVLSVESASSGVIVKTARESIHAGGFVNCCGAWAGELRPDCLAVEPVKGQMVTVGLAPDRLRCVLRTPSFYAIPRGDGRVAIGATLERAGFDPAVEDETISGLVRLAAEYLPEIGRAPRLESWVGFRPGTPDGLPILGTAAMEHCWHATGHFRNGILLAPVTARVIAQSMLGASPEVALDAFSPARFKSTDNLLRKVASSQQKG